MTPLAFLRKFARRAFMQPQRDLQSLRRLDRQNFELLVAEGFRRLGYTVHRRTPRPLGSAIEFCLSKDGCRTVVQCKQWRAMDVGEASVRELYGSMLAERADGALFVTSGTFTAEARSFAEDKPLGLIDGEALLELVEQARGDETEPPAAAPLCPVCDRQMVKMRGQRGGSLGAMFWSCRQYPRCKGARPVR